MAKVAITEQYLSDIADAIREKTGDSEATYLPSEMAEAIADIEGGGITPSGTMSITSNGTYDVTQYASADVNVSGGGGSMKPVAIRTDAELVQEWSYDKLLVEDEGIAIPSYSTTSVTLKPLQDITTDALDFDDYKYLYVAYGGTIPIYSGTPANTQWTDYTIMCYFAEFMHPIIAYSRDKTAQIQLSSTSARVTCSFGYRLYHKVGGSIALDTNPSYGIGVGNSTANLSSSNMLTLRVVPPITARGHNSYFPQQTWDKVIDARTQFRAKLFRCPNGDMNGDGWTVNQLVNRILTDFTSANHTLT